MSEFTKWKEMIYNAIVSFSDLDFQQRAWLDPSANISSSFVETYSTLYDDSFFAKFLEPNSWKQFGLSNALYIEMCSLKSMIDTYKEPETHEGILSDTEWHAIVHQAQKVVKLFREEI